MNNKPRQHRRRVAAAIVILCASPSLAEVPTIYRIPLTYTIPFGGGLTTQGGRMQVTQVSDDGTTFSGNWRPTNNGSTANRGFIWQVGQPEVVTVQNPDYNSQTFLAAMSSDGARGVGLGGSPKGLGLPSEPIYWDNAGNATIVSLPAGASSAGLIAVSPNHQFMLGSFDGATSGLAIWTGPGTPQVITDVNGNAINSFYPSGISNDGSVITGDDSSTGTYYQATRQPNGRYAVSVVPAPGLPPYYFGMNGQLPSNSGFGHLTLRTPDSLYGTQDFRDLLVNSGLAYTSGGSNLIDAVNFGGPCVVVGNRLVYSTFNDSESFWGTFDLGVHPTTWTPASGGTWGTDASWTRGSPNAKYAYARLDSSIAGPASVSLEADKTIAHLLISSPQAYAIAGPGTLHFCSSFVAGINVFAGSHVITAPVVVDVDPATGQGGFSVDVSGGASISIAGSFAPSASGVVLVKQGEGTLQVSDVTVGNVPGSNAFQAMYVMDGSVVARNIATPGGTPLPGTSISIGTGNPLVSAGLKVDSVRTAALMLNYGRLAITTGPRPGKLSRLGSYSCYDTVSTIDLGDNALIVDSYSGNAVATARNGGASGLWTGGGFTSSLAIADPSLYAVGTVSAGDLLGLTGSQVGTYMGDPVTAANVIFRGTYVGDTDLNGYVDGSDLANLLAGMHGGLKGWVNGDLNYDGKVDSADLASLLYALGHQGAPLGESGGGGGAGSVPEPTVALFLPFLGAALSRRRRSN